ncbi:MULTISPECIES: type II toxin-antitoxin system VapC family toxin [Acidithiobacillus]|uniref:Ribonuclease VapC n=1 Tax=Acidithiobacillus thiooxidans ATCC 19377 TaxID=637390 RepID=A0A5P9XN37_ACITH|nr:MULTISPECIES: type II toxin-antitoxin system VapC family toxin [Acidithiobacillus]MBU2743233.1 type II toxin-antitoxin system VapC family toxin [Acidithiobacillus albertensis]QFX95312.1 PIN domain-containing protein [Acidithiobacillus thiooxidans ATCC 19377]
MTFIADASMTLAWCFRDETAEFPNRVRERLLVEGLCVPAHWALEVCNALLAGARRGRITMPELRELLPDLRLLPEAIDHQTDAAAWSATLDLADEHGLTIYDAAYLELALRKKLPLATLDKQLLAAALAVGVALVPE